MKSEKLTAICMLSVIVGLSLFGFACDNPASPQETKSRNKSAYEAAYKKITKQMSPEDVNRLIGSKGIMQSGKVRKQDYYTWTESGGRRTLNVMFWRNKATWARFIDSDPKAGKMLVKILSTNFENPK